MEEGLQALQENKAEIQAARADAAVQELCSLFPWTAGNAAQAQCCRGWEKFSQIFKEGFCPDI